MKKFIILMALLGPSIVYGQCKTTFFNPMKLNADFSIGGVDCAPVASTGSTGIATLVTQAGAPSSACVSPGTANIAFSFDTTGKSLYYCNDSTGPVWRKFLDDGTGSGKTAYVSLSGVTSGSAGFTVNDVAGTAILYILPATNGAAGQVLYDTGSGTCPTLASGAPSVCHLLAWTSGKPLLSCDIVIGDASGSAISNSQLGPQVGMCFMANAGTVKEIEVRADGGTPNVIVAKSHLGTPANLVSSALATAASGARACSNTGGTTGIDGSTTCSATLQNTAFVAGDYFELISGTAGGTAKLFTIHIIYQPAN